jgi:hypothetical protein
VIDETIEVLDGDLLDDFSIGDYKIGLVHAEEAINSVDEMTTLFEFLSLTNRHFHTFHYRICRRTFEMHQQNFPSQRQLEKGSPK